MAVSLGDVVWVPRRHPAPLGDDRYGELGAALLTRHAAATRVPLLDVARWPVTTSQLP
jgi:hypothetical protein